jgi:hypothetical protein
MPPRRPDSRARDLRDGVVDVVQDRDDRHAGAPRRAVGAQLGEPAVVGARPGHPQLGVVLTPGTEARAERRGRAGRDRVGVGEDDLARDAVGVELLVASGRVPPLQPLFVLALPLGELLVAHPAPQLLLEDGAACSSSNAWWCFGSSQSRYCTFGSPA